MAYSLLIYKHAECWQNVCTTIQRHRCVSCRQRDKEMATTHTARLHMVDAEMLAECCSANNAVDQQNVLALPQNKTNESIGKAALAERSIAAA